MYCANARIRNCFLTKKCCWQVGILSKCKNSEVQGFNIVVAGCNVSPAGLRTFSLEPEWIHVGHGVSHVWFDECFRKSNPVFVSALLAPRLSLHMLESDFVSSRAEICGINANWEIQMDSSSFFYCCEIQESAFKTSYSCAWISPISLQTRFESLLTCKQLFPRGLCEEMHQWCRKNIAEHLFFSKCQQAVCSLVFCQQGHKAHIFMCYKVSENAVLCGTVGNYFPLLRAEGSFLSGSPGLAHQNPESDKPLFTGRSHSQLLSAHFSIIFFYFCGSS